jgi:hypothetical protein
LGTEYEKEHRVSNELKERLIVLQQQLSGMEREVGVVREENRRLEGEV